MIVPRPEIERYLSADDAMRSRTRVAADQECPDFVATTVSRQSKFKDFDETGDGTSNVRSLWCFLC